MSPRRSVTYIVQSSIRADLFRQVRESTTELSFDDTGGLLTVQAVSEYSRDVALHF